MGRTSDHIHARNAAEHVVRTLTGAGHVAYFAGGCVRDELLGLTPTDYDVATDATPDRITSLFPRTSEVGAHFGVVLVKHRDEVIEVATFRSDGDYSDRRRPDAVTFSNPRDDAQRRDFTVNALFLDPIASGPAPEGASVVTHPSRGRIIDFVGGISDLEARTLRAVGDPDKRLAEDHLRALRAVRLAARLSFIIDPATAEAIRRHARELQGVSRERIGEEVRRMAEHPSRAVAAKLIHELGLEAPVFTWTGDQGPRTWSVLAALQPESGFAATLAAWALDLGLKPGEETAVVQAWRKALMLSNDTKAQLSAILNTLPTLELGWSSLSVARQKRLAAGPWFSETMNVFHAANPTGAAAVEERLRELAATPSGLWPQPFVSGDDLVALGMKPGPRFKEILDGVLDAQLEGRVTNREEALELARRMGV